MSALLLAVLALQGPPPQDTSVTVQGVLGQAPAGGAWVLALSEPLRYRDRLIRELALAGDTTRWARYAGGEYVEARGTMAAAGSGPRGSLRVTAVREVEPDGAVSKWVTGSFSHRAVVTLWVVPRRFAWVDSLGQPTGVGPAIVYTFTDHGDSEMKLEFRSNEFVCGEVESRGFSGLWRFTRRLEQPNEPLTVSLPKFLREVVPLPREATPRPGRYVVRASLCGFGSYELETEIEVLR
ncbi:MAG: hypothetical protein ACREME_03580 [Gemmatimonadales bacterium]